MQQFRASSSPDGGDLTTTGDVSEGQHEINTPPLPVAVPQQPEIEEVTFYEGNGGSNAELAFSLLLGFTLVYFPLTMASIGRRIWSSFRITNKRIVFLNSSPLFKGESQISLSKIEEVRTQARAFGLWGDCVLFLKGGDRVEMLGMENYKDIKEHIERTKWTLRDSPKA